MQPVAADLAGLEGRAIPYRWATSGQHAQAVLWLVFFTLADVTAAACQGEKTSQRYGIWTSSAGPAGAPGLEPAGTGRCNRYYQEDGLPHRDGPDFSDAGCARLPSRGPGDYAARTPAFHDGCLSAFPATNGKHLPGRASIRGVLRAALLSWGREWPPHRVPRLTTLRQRLPSHRGWF